MRARPPSPPHADALRWVNATAAGLDSGRAESWACVPADRDPQPVRPFGTCPPDVSARADWLAACHIEPVARASTGVSWMPVSEILEVRGCKAHVVTARHLKPGPGRKRDVQECQWMQPLQTCGLLRGACRPAAERCAWRASLRHRATGLASRAAPIQHRQKALQQMPVQVTHVRSDITGTTGLAIIRASVAGERDPVQLAPFRDPRGQRRTEEIAHAWTGHDRPAQVCALKQALALYDTDTAQVWECDAEIARPVAAITPPGPDTRPPLARDATRDSHRTPAPTYAARGLWSPLTGVDVLAIPGLHARLVQPLLADMGLDRHPWPTVKAFASWLGLAPRHEISGGHVLRRGTLKTHTRAGQALRRAAHAVSRSRSGLGAYYRRLRARLGPQAAIVATAHNIARIVSHLRTHRTPFRDLGPEEYEPRARAREIAHLRKKAAKLGLTRVECPA